MGSSEVQPLNIGIIGGGIGGLSAAIALREAGHRVTVYEKYPWAENASIQPTLGNWLAVGANVSRILDGWGFDFKKAKSTPILQERVYDGQSLKLYDQFDFDYMKPATGYLWYGIRRSSLHVGMMDIIQDEREGQIAINIITGKHAVGIDCDLGTVTFKDGETVQHDLVVVSDGIRSTLIHSITNGSTPSFRPARTAFRFEMPINLIKDDPSLSCLFENQADGMIVFLIKEKGTFCLFAPSDEGEAVYGLLMHPAMEGNEDADRKWDIVASKKELVDFSSDFHPTLKGIVQLADMPTLWTMTAREPLKSCVRGRAVAIGDACHPHLPHHGQGAASSLEDAVALAEILSFEGLAAISNIKTSQTIQGSIPDLLSLYQSFRLPRSTAIQLLSMSFGKTVQEVEPQWREFGYQGPIPENINSHGQAVQLWLFQYDVRAEARKFLAEEKEK